MPKATGAADTGEAQTGGSAAKVGNCCGVTVSADIAGGGAPGKDANPNGAVAVRGAGNGVTCKEGARTTAGGSGVATVFKCGGAGVTVAWRNGAGDEAACRSVGAGCGSN